MVEILWNGRKTTNMSLFHQRTQQTYLFSWSVYSTPAPTPLLHTLPPTDTHTCTHTLNLTLYCFLERFEHFWDIFLHFSVFSGQKGFSGLSIAYFSDNGRVILKYSLQCNHVYAKRYQQELNQTRNCYVAGQHLHH